MTLDTPLTVTPAHLSALGPADAVCMTAELLWAEASRLGLPSTAVTISFDPNIPDKGVDASVDADVPLDSSLLRRGSNVIQIKSGNFKAWRQSQLRKELFGKRAASRESLGEPIRECFETGGRYLLLCTGVDLTSERRNKAVTALRKILLSLDYDKPSVDVLSQNHLIGALQPFPSLCFKLNHSGAGRFDTIDSWARQDQMSTSFKQGQEQEQLGRESCGEDAPKHGGSPCPLAWRGWYRKDTARTEGPEQAGTRSPRRLLRHAFSNSRQRAPCSVS